MTTTTSSRSLAIPFLGVLASLQMIDPTVANTALVQAGRSLQMHGATTLLMGFLADRLGRRRVLIASLLLALVLVGLGLAFVAVPQSALFVQEAPARYFATVTAFRTTGGQLGFAASGAMANGFGFSNLRTPLLDAGVGPQAIPALVTRCAPF